ncbi:hypothetical protein EC609_31910 [Achromobacter denitrificans]|nr:hypothetical protein EC609_31910 [Achromobacter denitrificans]
MPGQYGFTWRQRVPMAALAIALTGMAPAIAAAQSGQGLVTPQAYSEERLSLQKGISWRGRGPPTVA